MYLCFLSSVLIDQASSILSTLALGMAGGLRRSDSIADMMPEAVRQSRYHMKRCFQRYVAKGRTLMKRHQVLEELRRSAAEDQGGGFLGYVISCTQEAVVLPPYVNLAVRTNPGIWEYIRVHSDDLTVDQITPAGYLDCKDTLFYDYDNNSLVEVDFGALDNLSTPHLTLPSSIGNGLHLLSRFMSSRLAAAGTRTLLLDYLLALRHRGHKLMLSDTIIDTVDKLQAALLLAGAFLAGLQGNTPCQEFEHKLHEWGLERGWGHTAQACRETITCLSQLLQAPDPANMEGFFSRVPSLFTIAIFSVHGYFGQDKVLGLPDTGGQVVYILDQVRALEEELLHRIKRQGLNFTPRILVVGKHHASQL